MTHKIHGIECYRVGGKFYPVRNKRVPSLTDRIAMFGKTPSNFSQSLKFPKVKLRQSRRIKHNHSA